MYAHTPPPGGGWHGLEDHLRSVAELASDFAGKFGGEKLARAAGLLHDVGKYNPAFQQRLRALHEGRTAQRVRACNCGEARVSDARVPSGAPAL